VDQVAGGMLEQAEGSRWLRLVSGKGPPGAALKPPPARSFCSTYEKKGSAGLFPRGENFRVLHFPEIPACLEIDFAKACSFVLADRIVIRPTRTSGWSTRSRFC